MPSARGRRGSRGEQQLHSQLVEHRFLTPQLATMTMAAAVELMSPDVIDATMTLRSTVYLKGYEPLTFTDYLYSPEGMSLAAISTARRCCCSIGRGRRGCRSGRRANSGDFSGVKASKSNTRSRIAA